MLGFFGLKLVLRQFMLEMLKAKDGWCLRSQHQDILDGFFCNGTCSIATGHWGTSVNTVLDSNMEDVSSPGSDATLMFCSNPIHFEISTPDFECERKSGSIWDP